MLFVVLDQSFEISLQIFLRFVCTYLVLCGHCLCSVLGHVFVFCIDDTPLIIHDVFPPSFVLPVSTDHRKNIRLIMDSEPAK